ncbi:hypothetical protein GCM10029976_042780 [Kribbella albertanoniae]|uniref:DUF6112 family protein n=1 Tax=Kribbella albertanoniae TaxID=1266829 RepID=UPI001EDE91B1|nr:DUF6112 family protein [Kribbella albertanoniae]
MFSHIIFIQDPGIQPNTDGLPGLPEFRHMIGALLPFGLAVCVAVLILSAAAWALGSINGNAGYASKGKFGFLVALGAAILIGSSNALVRFFSAIQIG